MFPSPKNWLWPWSRTPEEPQPQSQSRSEVQSEPLSSSIDQLQPTPPGSKTTAPELQSEHSHQPQLQHPQTKPLLPPNLKLLLGGALFVPFTMLLTRRALRRRYLSTIPPYYTSTTHHRPHVNGAVDGVEAFSLASMHVMSFAMLASGAVACSLDVNSVEDLRAIMRRFTRQQVPVLAESGSSADDGKGDGEMRPRTDEEIENELQAFVAGIMDKQFQENTKKEVERRRKERGEVVDGKER